MKITVDAEKMSDSGYGIKTYNDKLEKNMDDLVLLIESLAGSWQGDAEKAYSSRVICLRREFMELQRFFTEYSNMLIRFAEEYERYEEELAAKIMEI